ncbi:unnamed protein product [Calypogeia fissa]
MSRVESPFHAIAAEALDDTPDVPVREEVEADGSPAPAPATTVATRSVDAEDGQDEDSSVKPLGLEPNTENGDQIGGDGEHGREENGGEDENGGAENGGNESSGKNAGPEQEAEETPALEQKVFSEGGAAEVNETVAKKSKKRTNVWTKTTSRKSAKKVKNNGVRGQSDAKDDNVLLKPFHQEDDPSYPILISKVYKAEKIELSADRLTASGSKGYRMVRATRGVVEGAWYFEIYVERLGDTGHTRLGWSTRRGDLQAPVGYDAHSYSYRDLDGCKVHAALREDYGEAYHEKDVIGFYINLPRDPGFTRKPEEEVVGYKGQPYIIVADEPLKPLPGSEILFFKNGVCQGVAFKDINDGGYFPAASMYTLPSQDCCKSVFNFGPDFRYPVTELGDRPLPLPMCQAPGPSGVARAEIFPTNQTEAVVQSTENGGDKWMAPDHGDPMEVEEATGAETGSALKARKKDLPATGSALKASKKDLHGTGLALKTGKKDLPGTGLIHKPSKKDLPATGPAYKPSKKPLLGAGLALKPSKKDLPGSGSANKSSKKELSGTGAVNKPSKKNLSGTGPAHKPSKKDLPGTGSALKPSKDLPPTGSAQKQSKKDLPGTGSALKPSKKDLPGAGSALKSSKKDLPGAGSVHKPSKKNLPGTGPAHKPNKKDLSGTGLGHKPGKKDLHGIGSIHRPNEFSGPGSLPRGLGPSAFTGGRDWGGIHGALNVDVVVVETSTPTRVEGHFR